MNNNTAAPASYNNTVDMNGGTGLIGGAGDLALGGTLQDGSLTKIGNGMLTLSGSDTYAGGTTINLGGTLADFPQRDARFASYGNLIITSSAALDLGGANPSRREHRRRRRQGNGIIGTIQESPRSKIQRQQLVHAERDPQAPT